MIESEVRHQIDRSLEAKGWILDAQDTKQNVFVENAVKTQLSKLSRRQLGPKIPDYTLFDGVQPIAVIEAKKSNLVNLDDALNQASDYASCMDIDIVFACNGLSLKSRHFNNSEPLIFNGVELNELPSLDILRKYHFENTNEVFTVSREVIKSREELINLFAELNNDFRAAGIRAGAERFTEFANILFLKLLSEKGEDDIWDTLMKLPEKEIVDYLNSVIIKRLRENYGGVVISPVTTESTPIIKKIVQKLNPLNLADIDEDIKGSAFEYFMEKTTAAQNDLGSILHRVTSFDSWLDFLIQSSVKPYMTRFVELVGFLRSPSSISVNNQASQCPHPKNFKRKRFSAVKKPPLPELQK